MPVEKQVLTIFAATKGHMDGLAINRVREFETEMHRYFERHPRSAEDWQWVAQTLEQQGRTDQAWWARERVERIRRNKARYGHRFALFQEAMGQRESARRTLKAAIEIDPDYAAAREELNRIERRIGLLAVVP